MTRIAVVSDSELPVRAPDVRVPDNRVRASDDAVHNSVDLLVAIVAAGHQVVSLDACDVLVVALTPGGRGLADHSVPTGLPSVAVIARSSHGFDETDRSSIETIADAYVFRANAIAGAIAWVASEDRDLRPRGQPRLTVVGSNREDFGMSRPVIAEPMMIGRSSSFGQHPQRPDRLPTPTGTIARIHARARCVDGVISVSDVGSTNGTLVIRWGEPARQLCPQGREFGPPATSWLVRDPTPDWVEIRIGDQVQLPGFWRFRLDGDPSWRPED